MGHRVGDAVRLREGSELYELLEPWADLTGRVAAVYGDGDLIAVDYVDPFPGYTGALPAADFLADIPLTAAPF